MLNLTDNVRTFPKLFAYTVLIIPVVDIKKNDDTKSYYNVN